jgi:hypothetical protein
MGVTQASEDAIPSRYIFRARAHLWYSVPGIVPCSDSFHLALLRREYFAKLFYNTIFVLSVFAPH